METEKVKGKLGEMVKSLMACSIGEVNRYHMLMQLLYNPYSHWLKFAIKFIIDISCS